MIIWYRLQCMYVMIIIKTIIIRMLQMVKSMNKDNVSAEIIMTKTTKRIFILKMPLTQTNLLNTNRLCYTIACFLKVRFEINCKFIVQNIKH